jgi:putative transposase
MVDTMGWILTVLITPANVQDRDGAKQLLEQVRDLFPRLKTIFADGGYAGQLVEWVRDACGWLLSIVKRTTPGFEVLPKRWIVERTFAWLTRYRRLARDYEQKPDTVQAMTYAAMVHLMLRRFAKQQRALPALK